jgi:glycosyltransferase involved in cell wall biosynthesis
MISTDRLIFTAGSEVRRRLLDYGNLFDELHVIVLAKKSLGHQKEQLTDNIFIYPTNSFNRLSYFWQAIKIGRSLLENGQDWVITSQDPFETGLIAWWLKRKKDITWQAQIHTDFLSPFFTRESWLNWLRVKLARFLLPQADKIRVVSKRIKDSLKNWPLKSEPDILPIFVPTMPDIVCDQTRDLHKKYPQFSFIILMASRLTKEKNFPLALGAFAEVVLDRSNLGLIIVGDGPERENLIKLAGTFKGGDQVIFEDWQCHLGCYYQTADLFMLTSNYEGYGRTIIEAGLNGCPVLTTDIGLVSELVNDQNALVCPVGDEDCLAEKMSWAVADKGQIKILGDKLKQDLERNHQTKEEYLKAYKKSLD